MLWMMQLRQLTNMEKQNDEPEFEELDFNKPDYVFTPNGIHEWRQQGPYLVCKSCELEHATYVGIDKQLIGIDGQGEPIMKEV